MMKQKLFSMNVKNEQRKIVSFWFLTISDIFQKVKVYEYRASLHLEKMEYIAAVNTAFECLRLLGIEISSTPSEEEILAGKYISCEIFDLYRGAQCI
jgi:hypothetical protein